MPTYDYNQRNKLEGKMMFNIHTLLQNWLKGEILLNHIIIISEIADCCDSAFMTNINEFVYHLDAYCSFRLEHKIKNERKYVIIEYKDLK